MYPPSPGLFLMQLPQHDVGNLARRRLAHRLSLLVQPADLRPHQGPVGLRCPGRGVRACGGLRRFGTIA